MLSRRHIRIKVLHALYAYQLDPSGGLVVVEKRLRESIDGIYRLYLFELKALRDIHRYAEELLEIKKQKKLPTQEDLNPRLTFVNNAFLRWLESDEKVQKAFEKHNISFGEDRELLRKIFRELSEDPQYQEYLQGENELTADKRIIRYLYGRYITLNETLHQLYEEHNLHWSDDLDVAQMMVAKTLKRFKGADHPDSSLLSLIKDEDDLVFAGKLLRKTIRESDELAERIRAKAENWETERIATVDIILMKMALAELMTFDQIPIKVSLNEYIELSKQYSTSKSSVFINGILDKIKEEMLAKGELRKIGRGLL